jgi:drug/metabolite transporter (DMT)-like permease
VAYLLLVSLIWPFSFGLIKNSLAGLDPAAVAAVRLGFALLVFLPFLRLSGTTVRQRSMLLGMGAVQFGVMYILYLHAFRFLQAHEVALFTITTPVFLTLFDAAWGRRLQTHHAVAALLSVFAAGLLVWRGAGGEGVITGAILLQVSNACFALGQLAYRHVRAETPGASDAQVFGWLYIGGLIATTSASLVDFSWGSFRPSVSQWGTLAYLGILSSGLCFFWWNKGATRVNAGTLAALNNAKVPLGVLCSLVVFNESANTWRLILSGALLALAVWVAERHKPAAR